MANGKEQGQENALLVQQWITERDAIGDYVEYERNGKVNRAALCSELGFGRSVVTQNPAVKQLLIEAETRWYGTEDQDTKAHDAARNRSEQRVAQTNRTINKLEDKLAEALAENSVLRERLERYEAMDAIIQSTGRAPR
ncbi:hypothetical protein [Neptuniibacter sp. QD37_11]|uniref:hypothetical protein n=1 Tax=Neptuniibacter sp. QD37_11 TaxID=3398209 RepID=UPI0039F4557D